MSNIWLKNNSSICWQLVELSSKVLFSLKDRSFYFPTLCMKQFSESKLLSKYKLDVETSITIINQMHKIFFFRENKITKFSIFWYKLIWISFWSYTDLQWSIFYAVYSKVKWYFLKIRNIENVQLRNFENLNLLNWL